MDPAAFRKNTAGDTRNLCNFGGGVLCSKGPGRSDISYRYFCDFSLSLLRDRVVRPEGLEPPTLGSEVANVRIETEGDAE